MSNLIAFLGVTGLSDVGYRFIGNTGAFSGSRITSGVYELAGARGVYGVTTPTFPAGAIGVYWDSTGTASAYAYEGFDFRFPNIDTSTAGGVLTAGTGTAQLSVTTGVAKADSIAISGDNAAADNLESMLDGTGSGTLSLLQLNIQQELNVSDFVIQNDITIGGVFSNAGGVTLATFSVSGAFSATSSSNDIRGVDVAKISGDAAAADNLELMFDGTGYAGGTIRLAVNAVQISGDATAADNLESMLDGTGGATLTLSQLNVANEIHMTDLVIEADVTVTNNLSVNAASFQTFGITGPFIAQHASNDVRGIAVRTNGISAASIATDAGTKIADAVDTKLTATHNAGSWSDIGGGSGSGAFTVTTTVRDTLSNLVAGAFVRLVAGVEQFTATSDALGVASFALNAATYTRAITKVGYQHTPDSIVVTAAANFNAEVVQTITPAAPANPNQCRVYAYILKKDGSPLRNAEMTATLNTDPARAGGSLLFTKSLKALSDVDGYVSLDLFLTSEIKPSYFSEDGVDGHATKWLIEIPAAGFAKKTRLLTTLLDLGTLIT